MPVDKKEEVIYPPTRPPFKGGEEDRGNSVNDLVLKGEEEERIRRQQEQIAGQSTGVEATINRLVGRDPRDTSKVLPKFPSQDKMLSKPRRIR